MYRRRFRTNRWDSSDSRQIPGHNNRQETRFRILNRRSKTPRGPKDCSFSHCQKLLVQLLNKKSGNVNEEISADYEGPLGNPEWRRKNGCGPPPIPMWILWGACVGVKGARVQKRGSKNGEAKRDWYCSMAGCEEDRKEFRLENILDPDEVVLKVWKFFWTENIILRGISGGRRRKNVEWDWKTWQNREMKGRIEAGKVGKLDIYRENPNVRNRLRRCEILIESLEGMNETLEEKSLSLGIYYGCETKSIKKKWRIHW